MGEVGLWGASDSALSLVATEARVGARPRAGTVAGVGVGIDGSSSEAGLSLTLSWGAGAENRPDTLKLISEVAEVLMGQTAAHFLEGLQSGSWLLQAGEEERPGELSWTAYLQPSPPSTCSSSSPGCPHPIIIEVKGHQGLWQLPQVGLKGT